MALASNQLIDVPISVGSVPKDKQGPRAIPLTLDFSSIATYPVDLTSASDRNIIEDVQTLYIDMAAATAPMTVIVGGSNQIIIAEPNIQGFYGVLAVKPLRFTFTSTAQAGNIVKIFMLNVAAGSAKWSTQTPTSGAQQVQDVAAEASLAQLTALIAAGKLAVAEATLDAAIATVGSTVKATAYQIAGTDGVNARTVQTDSGGRIVEANLSSLTQVPGGLNPTLTLMTAGSDGTRARALLTDNTGRVLVTDNQVAVVIGTPGSAAKTSSAQIGGSDGTNLRTLLTDASGRLSVATVGSGGSLYPALIGNLSKAATSTGGVATGIAGSPGYYITGFTITVDQNASLASAQTIQIALSDSSSGSIWLARVWVPATAASSTAVSSQIINSPPGFFWNNKVANSTLTISFPSLATGSLGYSISYGICSFVN